MTMQRWDPFNDVFSLRQAMDRLLEDAVIWPGRSSTSAGHSGFSIPIDVLERENAFTIKASLPGVPPENVQLSVQGNTLTIEGELREDAEQPVEQRQGEQGNGHRTPQEQPRYHQRERRYGRFSRQVVLPVTLDASDAAARFEHGVLTVTVPKAQEARQRRIPITAGSQSQQPATGQQPPALTGARPR